MYKSFILALTFLTRIPYPVRFSFNDEDFAKGALWLPVIGAIIGLPLYLFSVYLPIRDTGLSAFLMILLYLGLTGALHLDGLADYADGMFSGRDRDRILEIMKDSRIGTFGVIALCLYFLGMYVGLSEVLPIELLMMPVVGRTVGLMMCAFGTYPRHGGMGQAMVAYGKWYHGAIAILLLFLLTGALSIQLLVATLVTMVLMVVFLIRSTQVIGGVTGDVIGASVELSQVLWLLALLIMKGL